MKKNKPTPTKEEIAIVKNAIEYYKSEDDTESVLELEEELEQLIRIAKNEEINKT